MARLSNRTSSRRSNPSIDRFAALQAAAWSSGCFLHVPTGVSIERPFHIHSGMTDGGTDISHTLIVLEDNASATVFVECSSVTPTADGFHCGGLEIVVKPGATLRLVKLARMGRSRMALCSATSDRRRGCEHPMDAGGDGCEIRSSGSASFVDWRTCEEPSQRDDVPRAASSR